MSGDICEYAKTHKIDLNFKYSLREAKEIELLAGHYERDYFEHL